MLDNVIESFSILDLNSSLMEVPVDQKTTPVACRTPLPCDVPPGGLAVVLVDGRMADQNPVQGPGLLAPNRWQEDDKQVEAVLFPTTTLPLHFDVPDLRSAEDVRLDLSVTLALRLENPVRFLTDVVRDAAQFTEAELIARLRDTLRTSLAPVVRQRTLAELDADPDLRSWLGTVIEHGLRDESDLAGRSGLSVTGVDAFDLRCRVWDEEQQVKETYYLRTALAQAEAVGQKLLDQQVLAVLREHLPTKEELVERKERLADLTEREVVADVRLTVARQTRHAELQAWISTLRNPPSVLRPELWRKDLAEEIRTAPLCDGERVYVVTRSGCLHAFACQDGAPVWSQPTALGASPGDGMALAAGDLWVSGHDGVLYGVHPVSGAVRHRIPIGGKLSSAPLVAGDLLYLSVDVDVETLRPGTGDVVEVDAARGEVRRRWQVSQRGLRAQPVLAGHTLYVGDRRGQFYVLNLRRGRVEQLPVRGGRILGAALVDEARGQVIVGDSYGRVLALDRAGRERWSQRLDGPVVGQPLLHRETIYVGTGDGQVYALNPRDGEPLGEPFPTRGPIATPPVGWRDLVFVGSNDGYLYALEAATTACFWQYHSGSPVCVPPAVGVDGQLYVVDSSGHLNALRWCLSRYAEAARRVQEADPPRWAEAIELWLLAGEIQAALEAAEKAGRMDLMAELAARLDWHPKAAQVYEDLAQRSSDPLRAAVWWAEAAATWTLAGDDARAFRCQLEDARSRGAPLLTLQEANLPALTLGQSDVVQVRITNQTDMLARDVVLAHEGHVMRAGERSLGSLGRRESRLEAIEVVPTESGSAMLRVCVRYADPQGRPQQPVSLEARLKVAQPPSVHHHYYGPVVGRDGVIIMRGGQGGSGRTLHVQSGEDQIHIERTGWSVLCRACGRAAKPGDRWCEKCGEPLS